MLFNGARRPIQKQSPPQPSSFKPLWPKKWYFLIIEEAGWKTVGADSKGQAGEEEREKDKEMQEGKRILRLPVIQAREVKIRIVHYLTYQ